MCELLSSEVRDGGAYSSVVPQVLQAPGEGIVAGMETRIAGLQDGRTVEVEQVGLALDPAVEFFDTRLTGLGCFGIGASRFASMAQ